MSRPFRPQRLDRLSADARVPSIYRTITERNQVNWELKSPHRELTAKEVTNLEWAFVELSRRRLEYGAIKAIAELIQHPEVTVRGWRQKLLMDPNWRPNKDRHIRHYALTEEQEEQLKRKIINDYINPKRFCPPKIVKQLALDIWSEGPAGRAGKTFLASSHWRQGFLKRQGLSMRLPHFKRRRISDDGAVARFLNRMEMVQTQYTLDRLLNMDETSWIYNQHGRWTIAERGADEVQIETRFDDKARITAIATISADGDKLPLWVIAKGTTTECERRFEEAFSDEIQRGDLVITHAKAGWTTASVAIQYLAGLTDQYQPLDRRIFGSLKSRAKCRMDSWLRTHAMKEMDFTVPIRCLLDAWASITNNEVRRSWSHLISYEDE